MFIHGIVPQTGQVMSADQLIEYVLSQKTKIPLSSLHILTYGVQKYYHLEILWIYCKYRYEIDC
jgi:hypothetical protein